jgi:hypothetical protein
MRFGEIFKKADELAGHYRAVFETPSGQVVLSHLLKHGHVFEPLTTDNPITSAFHDGQRSVVLSILRRLQYKPEDLPSLREEYHV